MTQSKNPAHLPSMFAAMHAAHAQGYWIRAEHKPGRATRYSITRIGDADTVFSADDLGEITNWLRTRLH